MANEKRLIDANALSRRLFPIAMNLAKEYGSIGGAVSGVIGHIYDEPTVDAVEVVRCRDCIRCRYVEEDGAKVPSNWNQKPMINADRIRAMSDEELEEGIRRLSLGYEPWCDRHCKMNGDDDCNRCLRIWLQQPAEGE